MTKVSDIYNFIDGIAPFRNQDAWDNSGLLVGDMNARVKKALISLDASLKTADEAISSGCQLVITHHPIIFSPLKSLSAESPEGKLLINGIACISAHTNLDSADYGVSDMMADALGLANTRELVIVNREDPINHKSIGYGTVCESKGISPEDLASLCRKRFNCAALKYISGNKIIKRIGLVSGSGGESIDEAKRLNLDAVVTAEVKHHQFLSAQDAGITLIDAGHYETEAIAVPYLKKVLSEAFPEVGFIESENSFNIKTAE